jgi:hypothetical protein
MIQLIPPRHNPYWNVDMGKMLEIEYREKLLEIVRPTKLDWEILKRLEEATKKSKEELRDR